VSSSTHGWKLDSGATQHITNEAESFSTFLSYIVPRLLQVGKAAVHLRALGEGTIKFKVAASPHDLNGSTTMTLTRVWYCPECPFKLISTRRLVQAGNSIMLNSQGAAIFNKTLQPVVWMQLDASGLCTCLPTKTLKIPAGEEVALGPPMPVLAGVAGASAHSQLAGKCPETSSQGASEAGCALPPGTFPDQVPDQFWSCMVLYACFLTKFLTKFLTNFPDQLWSCMVLYGLVWSCMFS
jgi:hypothetical protein